MKRKLFLFFLSLFFLVGLGLALNLLRNNYLLGEFQKKHPGFLFVGFRPYLSVVKVSDDGDLKIAGVGYLNSGLAVKTKNTSRYPELVILDGGEVKGPPSLGVELNSKSRTYTRAAEGKFYFSLAPGDTVDLLIVSAGGYAYSYSIKAISKEKCASCVGQEFFRDSIIRERPEIESAINNGEWERVLLSLLDFASNRVVLGATSRSDIAYTFFPNDLTYTFSHNLSEGSCGLFTDYFRKIIKEFGFESASLDFGIDSSTYLTHVTAVVLAPDGKYYIFDPTFNATYRSRTGRLVDVEHAFGRPDILFSESKISRDIVLPKEGGYALRSINYLKANGYDTSGCRDTIINGKEFSLCPKAPCRSKFLAEVWSDQLARHNVNMKAGDADLFRALIKNGGIYSINSESVKVKNELTGILKGVGLIFH